MLSYIFNFALNLKSDKQAKMENSALFLSGEYP